jgi:hypothetical protein
MPTVDFEKVGLEQLPLPEKQGGSAFYWDQALPGFGVRVMGTGVSAYIAQARRPKKTTGEKSNAILVTIGRCHLYTLPEARFLAGAYLRRIREGADPRKEPPIEIATAVSSDKVISSIEEENNALRIENAALRKQNEEINSLLIYMTRERDELKAWLE